MDFTFNMGNWNTVFAVPAALVDKHLKLAGKEQLQVILWLLRHSGIPCSSAKISQELAMSLDDAEDALQYWIDCGLLLSQDSQLLPAVPDFPLDSPLDSPPVLDKSKLPADDAPNNSAVNPVTKHPPKKTKHRPKPDGLYLATRMAESPQLQFLIDEAQNILGKTLSPALSSALLMFFEDYGLPVEVIIMLLHYACNAGRTGTSYIESLARDWAECEVFTIEAAEEKLKQLDECKIAWKRLESVMGTYHRSPTKKEAAFAFTWIKEWRTSDELISEAYERCADKTGKLSLAYMNKILETWHKNGISSLKALAASEAVKQEIPKNEQSYDLDQLESISYLNPVDE